MEVRLWLLSTSLVVLAFVLHTFIRRPNPPIVNYDATAYFDPEMVRAPSTKEEVVELVKFAAENGRRIRVLGSGHSWSAVARSDDLLLSLHSLTGLVAVDAEAKQVTVRAGTTLRELNTLLDDRGLALQNLPSISDQTVAGVISTATHGTGITFGNLATLVTKLEFINGKGELITASPKHNPNLFKAAQVSIGMLGVITEVTLQCEDKFNLEETRECYSLEHCLANMDTLVRSAEHVKMWIEMYSGQCALFMSNRTRENPRDPLNVFVLDAKHLLFEMIMQILSWIPKATPAVMKTLVGNTDFFSPYNRVDKSYNVFNIPHYVPQHYEEEVAVRFEDCPKAIRELKRVADEFEIPVNLATEVRFVRGDDIWLSPEYQRDSCRITQTIYSPWTTARTYFVEFFKAVKKLGARMHWGKYFELTPQVVEAMYPKLHEFAAVRAEMDPKGVFLSELLSDTFGFQ